MKIRTLEIAGFGRLRDVTLAFGDGLTVVYGPNEAGKSTVAAAIVASLYGLQRGRKEFWRPWRGDVFRTTMRYELADGQTFEVRRDYARDAKGVAVYDRDGRDVAAAVAVGKTIAPGEAHLHLPYDAFVNASCVLQQAVAIDGDRKADAVATALARALDGGPKEDAALGALDRLDAARRTRVGTARATVNHPLRLLRERLAERQAAVDAARGIRDRLSEVRERRQSAVDERARLGARRALAERDLSALRAAEVRSRLDALHEYRLEVAARHAERERYADVASFPAEWIGELERSFYAWQAAAQSADAAVEEAHALRLDETEAVELTARIADAGTIDDEAFAELRAAAAKAEAARVAADAATAAAAGAARDGDGGKTLFGIALAVSALAAVLTTVAAIAHAWAIAETTGGLAALGFALVALRAGERRARARTAAAKQSEADAAHAAELQAAAAVAAVLARIGIATVDELGRRRERLAELRRKDDAARRSSERAAMLEAEAATLAQAFDAIADAFVPDVHGPRDVRRREAAQRAARRRQLDGIESAIAMLAVRRHEILRGADEFALHAQRDAYEASGVVPADTYVAGRADELGALLHDLDARIRDADIAVAEWSRELALGENGAAGDLAALEEECERVRAEVARVEAFGRALDLATATIERLTHEAHRAFARRLETYAAGVLGGITGGRYGDLRVDPATLAVRVRVPETGAIVDLESLSAGTRDQVYLIVRFAMARMFAEGLETPPLVLDDPFATWDDGRIGRCLPLIAENAFGSQTILLTASDDLAYAAAAIGATRIDL